MASLSVRKLDDQIYEQLRLRSLRHHVSMEEETRRIIAAAISAPELISRVFAQCFGTKKGIDLDKILYRHKPHEPMDLKS